ncbi:MAG: penicillin-binding protein 2 [Caldilineales bacterium]|nr:penicillin-binding protein 2 [Caldilineales bacterium]
MSNTQGNSIFRLRPETLQTATPPPLAPLATDRGEKPYNRILIVLIGFGLMGLVLVAQLVRYQALGKRYQVLSGSAAAATVDPLLPRGGIFDRNGNPLALDSYAYEIKAAPKEIAEKDLPAVARRVAPLVGKSESALLAELEAHKTSPYLVLHAGAGPEVGEEILSWGVYTVTSTPKPVRYYPEGYLFAHGLGFVNRERVGFYGLEGRFDGFLRASTTTTRWQAAPQPHGAAAAALPDSPFLPTFVQQDLILTIDRVIQHMAEETLRAAIAEYKAEGGTVIILSAADHSLLAMASAPDFNPNDYGNVADIEVFVNPAISKLYEPGSVFKLVTFAAALEHGVITPQSTFLDEDEFVYGERVIQNWDKKGRGEVTATEALVQSLNVTTAKIAVEVGRDAFYKMVRRFGFGQITGVELFGEAPGIVKMPGKGSWYPADLAMNSFGQGISVTPLQMANAVAAIAADGVLYRPHLLHQMIDGEKVTTVEPQPISRAISAETAATLTAMMVEAAANTPTVALPGYAIAGKSGTAQIPLPDQGYVDDLTITSFAGFFPADDPQFVILVKLVRPQNSRWATWNAGALFQTIVRHLIQLHSIPPDAIRLGLQPDTESETP